MRTFSRVLVVGCLLAAAMPASAQTPRPSDKPNGPADGDRLVTAAVARMLTLDADGNGKLAKTEVRDPRLQSLFARADTDHDELVTQDELRKLFTLETATASDRPGPRGASGRAPRRSHQ